jgi:predicted N-formylglutamate amidohydrolase
VARALASHFGAPLYGCLDSRLLADPNRAPDHPDLILAQSDGVFVPGNEQLDARAHAVRVERFHAPYHAALRAVVEHRLACGVRPFLLSIHSFEPSYAGVPRPWPVGVLWKTAEALAERLATALEQQGEEVGRNQPYDGRVALGYTLETHAIARELPHVLVEVRNDGIDTETGQQRWGALLAQALSTALPETFAGG